MKLSLNSNKGFIAVLICMMLPVIIALLGICIDGGILLYYDARLMSAAKFAAISATAFYDVTDGKAVLQGVNDSGPAFDAAKNALKMNFIDAQLYKFEINNTKKSECTVKAKVNVDFFFAKIFHVDGTTIEEEYTAERVIK